MNAANEKKIAHNILKYTYEENIKCRDILLNLLNCKLYKLDKKIPDILNTFQTAQNEIIKLLNESIADIQENNKELLEDSVDIANQLKHILNNEE